MAALISLVRACVGFNPRYMSCRRNVQRRALLGEHADFVPSIAVEDFFYGQPEKRAIFPVDRGSAKPATVRLINSNRNRLGNHPVTGELAQRHEYAAG